MLLFNEQHEQLNVEDVKAELKKANQGPAPTEAEVQEALGNYYSQALKLQSARFQVKAELTPAAGPLDQATFLPGVGAKILAEIKTIICGALDGSSTEDEVIQAVLSALSSIIPGGVLIKTLASVLIKYLLSKGIAAFCAVH
jgi:hypothetical protein